VQRRITELQHDTAERVQLTVGDLVAKVEEIRELAIADKQRSAAVGALKEIGILTGLRIDRREVGSPGEFDRLSDEELQQFIEATTLTFLVLPPDDDAT
jgi:hypothetical protein